MRALHLAMTGILVAVIFLIHAVPPIGAQCYGCGQNSSALKQALLEKQLPPIMISQVELNDSYHSISPGISCQQWNAMADQRLVPYYCTEDVVPKQAVECGHSMVNPNICVPVHITYNFTNACPFYSEFLPDGSPVIDKSARGIQWFVLYNPHDTPVSVTNFSLNWQSERSQEHNFDNFSLTLFPRESCTVAGDFVSSPNDTLQIQYDYQGGRELVSTPQLTDDNHDPRLWVFNGATWEFATPSNLTGNYHQALLSPSSQAKYGIDPHHVRCAEGLQLITKAEDGSPACVNPEDVGPLYLRGWAGGPFPQNIVFVIKPYSSGQVLVKFVNQSPETDLVLYPKLYDGFTRNQLDSSQLILDERPITIPHDKTRIITYDIVTKNISGLYWLRVAPCEFIPIYVEGFNSSIHYSDIQNFLTLYNCPQSGIQYHIIGTDGMGTKFVSYGS